MEILFNDISLTSVYFEKRIRYIEVSLSFFQLFNSKIIKGSSIPLEFEENDILNLMYSRGMKPFQKFPSET